MTTHRQRAQAVASMTIGITPLADLYQMAKRAPTVTANLVALWLVGRRHVLREIAECRADIEADRVREPI